jgi:restriction endonuclease S subunit
MPNTFIKIASVTVGSGGSSSLDFTSIPQTYTDLCLKISTRDNAASVQNNIIFKINGVTTSQSLRYLLGTGSGTSSVSDTPIYFASNANNSTSNTFSNIDVYIPNYASTSVNKSVSVDSVSENNATAAYAQLTAGLYASNTAITSISITGNASSTFLQYSTATLYGIKNS